MSTTKEELGLLREDIQQLSDNVELLERAIVGDPKDPEFQGLYERIRRLEMRWVGINRAVWVAAGAAFTGLVTAAWNFFGLPK